MSSKEPEVRRLAIKIARMIEERHGVPPGIGEIYAVLEFFIKYNPGADPEAIDWSIWDPHLPLELALKRLEEAYPGYIWRPPSPPMDKAIRGAPRPQPPPARAERRQPIRLEPGRPGIPPLGIGAGGCACGYGYHRRYALEPVPDSPTRRERPGRRASIMGIPLLPRGARGWRAGLIMLYRIFLLMVAIPVFLLFMAFSRD